ncbi:D-glycero-alpha-D-manno-heptose 1-phosphate guanylyltransferase [Rubripirellula lacrimiformis]|uniref:D-glycero-alpha-D-manno-heptose 1-phosphate guanylyltransferase n=1 Tax=Rubripirellula lacrimiformis TaxID=1930273 RepID=A0A517N8N3_9BACT|nr:nucleotidyltransferase family protein [Rubripirellula lacrimiformis]QDT03501.1 D-glycero-alpha-D-manno-heptose 1-phosphate guanylyltransferase [Rubripirellula lacrimiformis]
MIAPIHFDHNTEIDMAPQTLDDSQRLNRLSVHQTATILDAMQAIDAGVSGIALVVNEGGKLIGLLTDGDLRRALISGHDINAPITPLLKPKFHQVSEATSRTESLDLMKAFSIGQLPIVDDEGFPKGLHLLHEIVQPRSLPNAAMILAGGKGTRLGKITQNLPKPMVQVAGRPILERIVLHFVGAGVRKIYLSVNHLAEVIEDHFQDGSRFGCEITYLREQEPLGTGGSLALLKDQNLQAPLIAMNGDLIAEFDVQRMLETHSEDNNQITVGTRTYTHEVPFGCLQLKGNRIARLVEKPAHREIINAGIYVLEPKVIQTVPLEFTPITDVIQAEMDRNDSVGIYPIDSWIDVGLPSQLAQARGIQ